jgi:hypothetical protein
VIVEVSGKRILLDTKKNKCILVGAQHLILDTSSQGVGRSFGTMDLWSAVVCR